MSNEGFDQTISASNVCDFKTATGIIKFENKKATPHINRLTTKSGRMNRSSEIPDDLTATNSMLSPRLPNVISDESNTARGKASGTNAAL